MRTAVQIIGYLSKAVVDKDHRLAKETRRHFYNIVKDANGHLSKFEVAYGQIFIELKGSAGFNELEAALTPLDGVTIEKLSPIKLVFLKSQAQVSS